MTLDQPSPTFPDLPNELLICIFALTTNPEPLTRTCRLWHTIGQDPHATAAFLINQYGVAASLHRPHHGQPWRRLMTPKVCHLLLEAGAILPRVVIQQLLRAFPNCPNAAQPATIPCVYGNPLLGGVNESPPLPNGKSHQCSLDYPPYVKTLVDVGIELYGDCVADLQYGTDDSSFYHFLECVHHNWYPNFGQIETMQFLERLLQTYHFVPAEVQAWEWQEWEEFEAEMIGDDLGIGTHYTHFHRGDIIHDYYGIYHIFNDERALIGVVQSSNEWIYSLFDAIARNGLDTSQWKRRYNNKVVTSLLRYNDSVNLVPLQYVSVDTIVERGFTISEQAVLDAFVPLLKPVLSKVPSLIPYIDMNTLTTLAITALKRYPSLNHVEGSLIPNLLQTFPNLSHDTLVTTLWSLGDGHVLPNWQYDLGIFSIARHVGCMHFVPLRLFEMALEHMSRDELAVDKMFGCWLANCKAFSDGVYWVSRRIVYVGWEEGLERWCEDVRDGVDSPGDGGVWVEAIGDGTREAVQLKNRRLTPAETERNNRSSDEEFKTAIDLLTSLAGWLETWFKECSEGGRVVSH
ncbi:hypothetical protein HDV00_000734 [Rhizophlyctis rosea]|nr:hypothetical protein HDV00_000734 [Rhizophlyctis rosea]